MRNQLRNQSGFTLMELMIVIAIIGIVAAGVVPNLISWRNNSQLSAGARQVYSDMQSARREAIKANSTATINFGFNPPTEYRIDVPGSVKYPQIKQMPPGVNFFNAAFVPNAPTTTLSFNNMGFGRTNANVDSGGSVSVRLASGSGRVSTINVTSGGSVRIQ